MGGLKYFKRKLLNVINSFLSPSGFRIISKIKHMRDFWAFFEHLKKRGFQVKTVVDVGVATETRYLYDWCPGARIILIEPLREFEPSLRAICNKYRKAEYFLAAAGAEPGNVTMNVVQGLGGSSILEARESKYIKFIKRTVPMTTLDLIDYEKKLEPPAILKIDVQGGELEVLKGATEFLKKCEIVILETMTIEQYIGQPILHNYIEFMKNAGFVVYDVIGMGYTFVTDRLGYVDFAFVKENSFLNEDQRWFSENQTHMIIDNYDGVTIQED